MGQGNGGLLAGLAIGLSLAVAARPAAAAELLMVEEPGCSWCKRWHQEIGIAYPRTEEGRRAPLRVVQLREVRSLGLALAAPVTVTPTFILMEARREVGRITGHPGADFFWGLLAELLAKLDPELPEPEAIKIKFTPGE